jgi:hypothetical protein
MPQPIFFVVLQFDFDESDSSISKNKREHVTRTRTDFANAKASEGPVVVPKQQASRLNISN